MNSRPYKFLSTLFVVAMLTISTSASACLPVTISYLKLFDYTAQMNQAYLFQRQNYKNNPSLFMDDKPLLLQSFDLVNESEQTPITENDLSKSPIHIFSVTERPVVTSTATDSQRAISAYEMEVIHLVNEIRSHNGLNTLEPNAKLCEIACTKSQDMQTNSYFAHQSPTYGSPFDMLLQFDVIYRTAGENIAYGYTTPDDVVEGWMNSQGHRENILNPNYTEIGVGYVESGHYWTQLFIG